MAKTNTSILSTVPAGPAFADDETRETAVKVENVSMVFNKASERLNNLKEYAIALARHQLFFEAFKALDGVSFEVKKGDVYGIMGTNGSGKSTILKIIAGVMDPSEGKVSINGRIAPLIELGAGFDHELSARENVFLNGALLGYSKEFIEEHFDQIVQFAEVEQFLDMPLKNFSSGMIARIAFAVATVMVPDILIVDEVLSVGDFMFQRKCEDRISELINEYGVTVLIVSHSTEQIERLCNKAIWIEKGHTRMISDAKTVCKLYRALGGRLGSAESETKIVNMLNNSSFKMPAESVWNKVIAGDTAFDTGAEMSFMATEGADIKTAIVAGGHTHVNGPLCAGLCKKMNAICLPISTERIPSAALRALKHFTPERIYIVDAFGASVRACNTLNRLEWDPTIQIVSNSYDHFELSLEVLKFGNDHKAWGQTVVITDFDNNPESIAIAPYLHRNSAPLIVTDGHDVPNASELARTLLDCSIDNVLIIGDTLSCSSVQALEDSGLTCKRLDGGSTASTFSKVFKLTYNDFKQGPSSINIAASTLEISSWPELFCTGQYASETNSLLLLESNTDLDQVADCLDFVRDHKDEIADMVFIGDSAGLDPSNKQLLYEALHA